MNIHASKIKQWLHTYAYNTATRIQKNLTVAYICLHHGYTYPEKPQWHTSAYSTATHIQKNLTVPYIGLQHGYTYPEIPHSAIHRLTARLHISRKASQCHT